MMDGEQQKRAVEAQFDQVAATFGQVGPDFFGYFGRRLVEFARIPAGARVLDAACGRGATLFPGVEKVGADGEVIGIDLSGGMAAETKREIAARRLRNARALQMDVENLHFPDGRFDAVICAFALFYFPDLKRAMGEIRRVLVQGGLLAAATWSRQRDQRWNWLLPLVRSYLPPEEEVSGGGPDFGTRTGLTAILTEAGFREIRVETHAREFLYRSEDEWWARGWAHGELREIETEAGPEGLQRFKAEAFEKMQTFRTAEGFYQRIEAVFAVGRKG